MEDCDEGKTVGVDAYRCRGSAISCRRRWSEGSPYHPRAKERIEAYAHLDLLVLAARPISERASKLTLVDSVLYENGFNVQHIQVTPGKETHYKSLANKVFELLRAKL